MPVKSLLLSATLLLTALGSVHAQNETWTSIATTTDGRGYYGFSSLAFGNGRFVAMKDASWNFATSTDGYNWNYGSVAGGDFWGGRVHYINNQFIATGATVISTSSDGVNWSSTAPITSSGMLDHFTNIAHNGSHYVASLWNSASYAISTDGLNWTKGTVDAGAGLVSGLDIAYANGAFIYTTNGSGQVYRSTDGTSWSALAGISTAGGYRVEYGNGQWMLYGQSNYLTSTDGLTWESHARPGATGTQDFFFSEATGEFIVGMNGPSFYAFATSDGETWETLGDPASTTGSVVAWAYGSGVYVGAGLRGWHEGVMVIDAAATAIPEPSTYALVFGGLALAGVIVRRRHARAS